MVRRTINSVAAIQCQYLHLQSRELKNRIVRDAAKIICAWNLVRLLSVILIWRRNTHLY